MNNNYCRYDISDGCGVVGGEEKDLGVWSTLGAQRNHSEAGTWRCVSSSARRQEKQLLTIGPTVRQTERRSDGW